MSAAARKELRNDLVQRLKASETVTALVDATKIYHSRAPRLKELPAVSVYTPRTRRKNRSIAAPEYECTHDVVIQCVATAEDEATLADLLDDIAAAVGAAFLEDPEFIAAYEAVDDVDENMAINSESDALRGVVDMRFAVVHSDARPPDLAGADDLATVAVTVQPIEPETNEPGDAEIDVEITGLDE